MQPSIARCGVCGQSLDPNAAARRETILVAARLVAVFAGIVIAGTLLLALLYFLL